MSYRLALIPFILGACTSADEPRPTVTSVQDETIITSTASTSNTLVLDRKTDFVTCTAPAPDATFSQGEGGKVSASVAGNNDDVGFQENSSASALPGRTPAVLMTRELFFRACEFSRNYGLSKDEAYHLYLKTMEAAARGWKAEGAKTTVSIGDSQVADVTNQTLVVPGGSSLADNADDVSSDGF